MVIRRVVKPKTQRGKRFLESREPKIFENTKKTMFVKGGNTSLTVTTLLKEMYQLKKADSIMYKRKNILRPFEDETPLEFFSQKSDASLFMFGSHSKKRPNNVVIGRMFDHHVLDMVELGVEKFTSMFDVQGMKCSVGIKPCLMFTGEAFDQEEEYIRLKNLLLDFFRGPEVKQIRLAGIEHVILISAIDGKIFLRNYRILMKKSGSRTPRIELEDMGPSVDFGMRRTKLASDDLYKRSLKIPKNATLLQEYLQHVQQFGPDLGPNCLHRLSVEDTSKIKKRKNVSQDAFGSKLGRIHMTKQDLDNLQTRKMKGLKRKSSVNNKSDSPKKQKEAENTDT